MYVLYAEMDEGDLGCCEWDNKNNVNDRMHANTLSLKYIVEFPNETRADEHESGLIQQMRNVTRGKQLMHYNTR